MKKYFNLAMAVFFFAGCSSEGYVGDQELKEANEHVPIVFGSGVGAITRADKTGSAAASDLNNQFYVYGVKKESTDGVAAASTGNLVYKNYVVKWVDNTANSTTSNTHGWEYVGYTLDADEQSNVSPNSGSAAQTIKYWDYGAADYTFYAFSALPADITAGKVKVTKTESVTSPSTVYDKGYTVTLSDAASLDKLFFAERINILTSNNTDRTQDNKYGGNVTFKFHNVTAKIRVGMYETIPGYSVTINKFSVDNDGVAPAFSAMTDDVTTNFAANMQYYPAGSAGNMTITYDANDGNTKNYPKVSFTPTSGTGVNKVLALGTNLKASTVLGESTTGATYDQSGGGYTSIFPNEANTQNMKVKLSYTLTAPETGETITITDATAEIPAKYLQWKGGYAYTYLFKISENSNGQSGQGITGLYPITFDAVEVLGDNGSAEYITTVSEPSITTFGVSGGSYVSGGSEYAVGSDIYATFMEGSNVITPTTSNYKVYSVTTTNATTYPITEASVAESVANPTNNKITCTAYTTNVSIVDKVPGEDGVDITINAVKMAGLAAGTYAIEYTPTSGNKVYKVIKVVTP